MGLRILGFTIALALLPAVVAAAERPDWAFPPPGVTGAPRPPETGELKRVPGSRRTYTQSQIDSFNDPPDWFPDEHPPTPAIVAHGKGPQVRACMSCHLSTGMGHPENSRLAGAPYIHDWTRPADGSPPTADMSLPGRGADRWKLVTSSMCTRCYHGIPRRSANFN